jgi:hypothetical protein
MANISNSVPVTLACLNRTNAFFAIEHETGLTIAGWNIVIGHAVFCGRILDTKVDISSNHSINKIRNWIKMTAQMHLESA